MATESSERLHLNANVSQFISKIHKERLDKTLLLGKIAKMIHDTQTNNHQEHNSYDFQAWEGERSDDTVGKRERKFQDWKGQEVGSCLFQKGFFD